MSPPTMTGSRLGNSVPRASGDEPDLPVEIHVTPPRVPRASGDEPAQNESLRLQIECSPRERG